MEVVGTAVTSVLLSVAGTVIANQVLPQQTANAVGAMFMGTAFECVAPMLPPAVAQVGRSIVQNYPAAAGAAGAKPEEDKRIKEEENAKKEKEKAKKEEEKVKDREKSEKEKEKERLRRDKEKLRLKEKESNEKEKERKEKEKEKERKEKEKEKDKREKEKEKEKERKEKEKLRKEKERKRLADRDLKKQAQTENLWKILVGGKKNLGGWLSTTTVKKDKSISKKEATHIPEKATKTKTPSAPAPAPATAENQGFLFSASQLFSDYFATKPAPITKQAPKPVQKKVITSISKPVTKTSILKNNTSSKNTSRPKSKSTSKSGSKRFNISIHS